MRLGGTGGPNANNVETDMCTTDSPTEITVQCVNERSQLSMKKKSLELLKGKQGVVFQVQRVKDLRETSREAVVAVWGQRDDDGKSVALDLSEKKSSKPVCVLRPHPLRGHRQRP